MLTIQRYETGPRMSQAVECNGFVFLAGQVASDTSLDAGGQMVQVLAAIDRLLQAAGSDKTRIVSATLWLLNIDDYASVNVAWDAWVPAGHAPARACVEARLAAPGYRVEVGIVAASRPR